MIYCKCCKQRVTKVLGSKDLEALCDLMREQGLSPTRQRDEIIVPTEKGQVVVRARDYYFMSTERFPGFNFRFFGDGGWNYILEV